VRGWSSTPYAMSNSPAKRFSLSDSASQPLETIAVPGVCPCGEGSRVGCSDEHRSTAYEHGGNSPNRKGRRQDESRDVCGPRSWARHGVSVSVIERIRQGCAIPSLREQGMDICDERVGTHTPPWGATLWAIDGLFCTQIAAGTEGSGPFAKTQMAFLSG
jgi:hypothetical protein